MLGRAYAAMWRVFVRIDRLTWRTRVSLFVLRWKLHARLTLMQPLCIDEYERAFVSLACLPSNCVGEVPLNTAPSIACCCTLLDSLVGCHGQPVAAPRLTIQ